MNLGTHGMRRKLLGLLLGLGLGLAWTETLRADAPAGRYVLRACGTVVYDTKTRIEWQRQVPDSKKPSDQSAGVCGQLNLDGIGWRVPTLLEVLSLQYLTRKAPTIDARAFPNTPSGEYVTATRANGVLQLVSFETGDISSNPAALVYTRCLRSRP